MKAIVFGMLILASFIGTECMKFNLNEDERTILILVLFGSILAFMFIANVIYKSKK
jgi:hypothetical protein